jgi:hypothetical protein
MPVASFQAAGKKRIVDQPRAISAFACSIVSLPSSVMEPVEAKVGMNSRCLPPSSS